jgi:flagellum-specific peptidoglycan hydrolase FlgJ
MKETITIILSDKKNTNGRNPYAGNNVPALNRKTQNKAISSLKRILLSFSHALKIQRLEHKPIAAIGKNVLRYRFPLAIIGLAFMFLFKNDNTQAISYNNDDHEANHSGIISGIEDGANRTEEVEQKTKKQKKKEVKLKVITSEKVKRSENEKTYHMPSIPDASHKEKSAERELGRHAQKIRDEYINRYAKLAQTEQKKYGIPASVSLGLAILNSDFGHSQAAKEGNNHFGIKCHENSIRMGKGMVGQSVNNDICYTSYESAWVAFRANSKLLEKNYKNVLRKGDKSHLTFIMELESAGYFTKKGYSADALMNVIENYRLSKFD